MSANVFKFNGTGTAALALDGAVPVGQHYRLVSFTLNLSAAPTTSENLTVTLDAHAGAIYDTLLYSLDLSAGATADLVWQPEDEILLEGGDVVTVAWANTDARNWGAQLTFKAV
jgi:hypothetical protein